MFLDSTYPACSPQCCSFNSSEEPDDFDDNKTPSVARRIFTYVIPGMLVGAGLSVASLGWLSVVLICSSVRGIPQIVRKCVTGEISIKNEWAELWTIKKVYFLAIGTLLAVTTVAFIALNISVLTTTTNLVGGVSCMAFCGAIAGAFFSAGLSDPPLLDLSDYKIERRYY